MRDACEDLRAECRELAEFCAGLSAQDWHRLTDFYDWRVWDEIAHLHYSDRTALQSVTDPAAFTAGIPELAKAFAAGKKIREMGHEAFGHLDGPALLASWRDCFESLAAALLETDPSARLPWYGPSMGVRSFISARLMETWARGQDIWDLLQRPRGGTARLRAIAHLGVTTFGWTFANRKLPVPPRAPFVELQAPNGETWAWGEPSAFERVWGSAQDFCLLVTQRRHRSDTSLQWSGNAAERWTAMAQCFAGPPTDGPVAGARVAI